MYQIHFTNRMSNHDDLLLVHEFATSIPGKYQCDFFNSYVLSKLILNISDIGEEKHRVVRKPGPKINIILELTILPCASVVFNAHEHSLDKKRSLPSSETKIGWFC